MRGKNNVGSIRRCGMILGVLAMMAAPTAVALAQDPEPPQQVQNVQIVFDASGSMWGQINRQNKIIIAREVMGDFLKTLNPDIRVGLTAYGHRRKGDCADIEEIVPADRGAGERISKAIQTINPKGKTPLTEAVRQAAKSLRYREEAATVILVTDGLETCNADPCALSAELEKDGIEFTAHVIGFDVAREETATLKCIADNTGGEFLSADNASELKEALGTTIRKIAEQADNVGLQAVMAEGGEPIADHLYYYVYDAETGEEVKGTNVAAPRISLKPGTYRVRVRHGEIAFAEKVITVPEDDKLQDTIVMETGLLAVKSKETETSAPLTSGPVYRIYNQRADGERGAQVLFNNNAQATFILPAGNYVVRAAWGSAAAEEAFSIQAGEPTDLVVNLNVGELKLSSTASAGGDILTSGTVWRVYEKGEDGSQGVELAFNNNAQISFRLSEGDYIVKATNKSATAFEEVSVKAGATTEHTVNLDMGWIKPIVALENGEEILFCHKIINVSDGKTAANSCPSEPPRYGVSAGTYYVDAYKWLQKNKRVKSEEFTLSPGETREVRMIYTGPPLE